MHVLVVRLENSNEILIVFKMGQRGEEAEERILLGITQENGHIPSQVWKWLKPMP